MKKIVVNRCYGGFGISRECAEFLGLKWHVWSDSRSDYGYVEEDVARDDPKLIEFIEKHGSDAASDRHAELAIVEIPDDVDNWEIGEYDGSEWVREKHRTWYA